jgi:hypothetical protein
MPTSKKNNRLSILLGPIRLIGGGRNHESHLAQLRSFVGVLWTQAGELPPAECPTVWRGPTPCPIGVRQPWRAPTQANDSGYGKLFEQSAQPGLAAPRRWRNAGRNLIRHAQCLHDESCFAASHRRRPHSAPTCSPFSATERFMKNTSTTSPKASIAATQKISKYASDAACSCRTLLNDCQAIC